MNDLPIVNDTTWSGNITKVSIDTGVNISIIRSEVILPNLDVPVWSNRPEINVPTWNKNETWESHRSNNLNLYN